MRRPAGDGRPGGGRGPLPGGARSHPLPADRPPLRPRRPPAAHPRSATKSAARRGPGAASRPRPLPARPAGPGKSCPAHPLPPGAPTPRGPAGGAGPGGAGRGPRARRERAPPPPPPPPPAITHRAAGNVWCPCLRRPRGGRRASAAAPGAAGRARAAGAGGGGGGGGARRPRRGELLQKSPNNVNYLCYAPPPRARARAPAARARAPLRPLRRRRGGDGGPATGADSAQRRRPPGLRARPAPPARSAPPAGPPARPVRTAPSAPPPPRSAARSAPPAPPRAARPAAELRASGRARCKLASFPPPGVPRSRAGATGEGAGAQGRGGRGGSSIPSPACPKKNHPAEQAESLAGAPGTAGPLSGRPHKAAGGAVRRPWPARGETEAPSGREPRRGSTGSAPSSGECFIFWSPQSAPDFHTQGNRRDRRAPRPRPHGPAAGPPGRRGSRFCCTVALASGSPL